MVGMTDRVVQISLVAFLSAFIATAPRTTAFAQGKGETVVGAPVTPSRLTDIQPEKPYHQVVPGLLARTVYVAEGTSRRHLEFWDVMVGPGKTSEPTELPGSGVIDVRSGSGSLHSAGDAQRLRTGSILAFDEGSSLSFINDSRDEPLILRVTLIQGLPR